jgi:hypothetical protein
MRTIKTRVLTAVAGFALFIGGVAVAQKPRQNVSGELHPNIGSTAAQPARLGANRSGSGSQ